VTDTSTDPLVVTVDGEGRISGTSPRLAAHQEGGIRHLAISVVVIDSAGRVLLQRRADTKALFAGRWSNTVCTHPLPGEAPIDAATRRLQEELSVTCGLSPVGTFSYEAHDLASGLSENELDHVFVGRSDTTPVPNPVEVAAVRWVSPVDLASEMATSPDEFTPWLRPVLVTAGIDAEPSAAPSEKISAEPHEPSLEIR
jgi:isopentenyl-diphosphate delta-isomerase